MPHLNHLRLEKADGVARITLALPKHKAMNIAMMQELNGMLEALPSDNELKCLVILAEGRSWCAGVEVGDRKPELVGPAKPIETCTSGRTYTTVEALNMGLVSQVVDDERFGKAVNSQIDEIRGSSSLIVRMNKRAIRMTQGLEFVEALREENDYFLNSLMKIEDTLEGIRSFEEKCKPVWKNN